MGVATNQKHAICKRDLWKIYEHIATDVYLHLALIGREQLPRKNLTLISLGFLKVVFPDGEVGGCVSI